MRSVDFLVLSLLASSAAALPPVPPKATPTCDAMASGRCYNVGGFTLSVPDSDADHFRVCRSVDTLGWGGCNQTISLDTGPSFLVDGADLPADGFRRAYYWSACDATGACTPWKDNPEVYVYRDASGPVAVAAESEPIWVVDDGSTYTLAVTASDAGSGVEEIRTGINLPKTGGREPRGFLSWHRDSYRFADDRVGCTGGGFGSKHHQLYRPTTVTLVGCSTALDEGERTVSFELLPNPTFGALTGNHVSLRAWDAVGRFTSWRAFVTVLASLRPADRRGEGIGYQGILDQSGIDEAVAEGIGVNLATLLYQRKACASFFWQTVDTAGILAAYRAHNVRAMVILENFLFRNVNDTEGDDCQPIDPPPPPEPSPCFNDQKWRLIPDWQARLDTFAAIHGQHLAPEDVAFFLVSSEVNDRCFDLAEVEAVALAVRDRFPGIPLGMIYGATHDLDGERGSQPPPPFFPSIFDLVGLFSYDIFDVNDPLESRNVTGLYYDPERPESPTTIYGDLLSKLHPHQDVLLVFDAGFGGKKQALGWLPEDLGTVARNYVDFMKHRPEVKMMGGFTWQRLLLLPESVRAEHRELVCRDFDNASPLCDVP